MTTNTIKNFTIGQVLSDKGIVIVTKPIGKNKVSVSIKKTKQDKDNSSSSLPFCCLKSHFKRIKMQAKEELNKALSSGADLLYIFKTPKELGDNDPVFDWENGALRFKRLDKKSRAKQVA